MPKVKATLRQKALSFKNKFPEKFRQTPSNELFCVLCEKVVTCEKSYFVEQHRCASIHTRKFNQRSANQSKDNCVPSSSGKQAFLHFRQDPFKELLVQCLLELNIPLNKLRHPSAKKLADYCGRDLPSVSSARRIVQSIGESKIDDIKRKLKDQNIFVISDESCCKNLKFVNVMCGRLDEPHKTYLVSCKTIQKVDSDNVLRMIHDAMIMMNVERGNVLLFISDAAPYMIRCGLTLKSLYPKLRHLTCLAHLIHNCSERVRGTFGAIDNLIATVKSATVKNRSRLNMFEKIGAPPQPILTRWASWLEAASYYSDNFNEVKTIVLSFSDDGLLVQKAKQAVNAREITDELVCVCTYTCKYCQKVRKSELHNSSSV